MHLLELLLPQVTHGAGVQVKPEGVLQGSGGDLGLVRQVVECEAVVGVRFDVTTQPRQPIGWRGCGFAAALVLA